MEKRSDKRKKIKAQSGAVRHLIIIFRSFLIQTFTYILLCVFALIADIKRENYLTLTLVALVFGAVAAGFSTGRTVRQKGYFYAMVYSLPSAAIYILISALLNKFDVSYMTLITFILIIVFSALGGIISVNIKRKIKVKR